MFDKFSTISYSILEFFFGIIGGVISKNASSFVYLITEGARSYFDFNIFLFLWFHCFTGKKIEQGCDLGWVKCKVV